MLRELAASVRARRVASRELVGLALQRIDRLDRSIGAVVALRAEEALEEAAALDARVARGEDPGALAGIPCLIKDIEDLEGIPTTHGSLLFRDAPSARRDGLLAARLRAAGAIPVGKANTPEFAAEGFTANALFGATRNPWAPEWSPGGSSGGSAAAIAAGIVPIATATDTGGSIRIPAAFCGLVGLKPTNGLVGRDPALCWPELTTSGPLAVSVDDVRLLMEVHVGAIPGDPLGLPTADGAPVPPPRRALAAPRFSLGPALPDDVAGVYEEGLAAVERDLDLEVEAVPSVLAEDDPELDWGAWTAPELVAWLGRDRAERSLELLFPTTRSFVERGLRMSLDEYLGARGRRFHHARRLHELLDGGGVIVTPTLAAAGWRPDGGMPGTDLSSPPPEVYNVSIHNMAGVPAITLPAGRLPNGVPFGLQVTGPRLGDGMLLDLAERWELARPWPPASEGYEPFRA